MAALALKDTTALVEQKQKMDKAVDSLRNRAGMRLLFRVAEQRVMVRF